ncbi:MAG: hypothetical protein Q4A08_08345 [Bacteroidales bacterium]|nr:hypothetical protein [Bacteroidales bacterium]
MKSVLQWLQCQCPYRPVVVAVGMYPSLTNVGVCWNNPISILCTSDDSELSKYARNGAIVCMSAIRLKAPSSRQ